ncbi:follistatin-related protein 5 [Trichonephila inaurata madagascariensis]|uniref:Follistatin-related protein 5 n=1 Tax=Trichonephila inaurata madagascariensis TaxID=2747483 RepID=A0A8X7CQB1_9ARAC|nr:follistatin-related protein 5 [Trichonephila inaurata madagascariensis]
MSCGKKEGRDENFLFTPAVLKIHVRRPLGRESEVNQWGGPHARVSKEAFGGRAFPSTPRTTDPVPPRTSSSITGMLASRRNVGDVKRLEPQKKSPLCRRTPVKPPLKMLSRETDSANSFFDPPFKFSLRGQGNLEEYSQLGNCRARFLWVPVQILLTECYFRLAGRIYFEKKKEDDSLLWKNLPPFETRRTIVVTPDPNPDSTQRECSHEDYDFMKENLLVFNNEKLMDSKKSGNEYLVSIMFSHYDQNNNGQLEAEELWQAAERDHLGQLSTSCILADMLLFDDADKDGRLNINEFYLAFSKLYSKWTPVSSMLSLRFPRGVFPSPLNPCPSVVPLSSRRVSVWCVSGVSGQSTEVNHVTARVGDNVEVKCDVTGTPPPPIIWRRNDMDLSVLNDEEIKVSQVFVDGSLYLTNVQLVHAGNYTCHAQRNKDITQTHVLHVQTLPEVHVVPKLQSRAPGELAEMECHVIGVPQPRVYWLKNDEELKMGSEKYTIIGNSTALVVGKITYSDTGAYMCVATNPAGTTRDISSLVVQDQPARSIPHLEHRFFAFHDWGGFRVRAAIFPPLIRSRPGVIPGPGMGGQGPIARCPQRADRSCTPPPTRQDPTSPSADGRCRYLGHGWKYGYVVHTNQRGMYKLDLQGMKYLKTVDLTPYNCAPKTADFASFGGLVILECLEPVTGRPTGQIVLDYLTDTVLVHSTTLFGRPHVSPDSRRVVTLKANDHSVVIVAQEITEDDNAPNQRRGLLSFQNDALLRFVRDVFFKGGHPLCGSLGWQSGDDHRHRPSFRPPTGRLGQQQPPHRECGRVWHVHGPPRAQDAPFCCQKRENGTGD